MQSAFEVMRTMMKPGLDAALDRGGLEPCHLTSGTPICSITLSILELVQVCVHSKMLCANCSISLRIFEASIKCDFVAICVRTHLFTLLVIKLESKHAGT
jgi:hypothetical protein